MSNMSYCRFQNTAQDLEDCIDAIENGEINELSNSEIDALMRLTELAETVLNLNEEIEQGIENSENSDFNNC